MKKTSGKKDVDWTWQDDWETGVKLGELFDKAAGIIDDHYFDVLFGELRQARA